MMLNESSPGVVRVTVRVCPSDRPSVSYPVRLSYTDADPCAVRLAFLFGDGTESTTYTFARDLLADGLASQVGELDVQVAPHALYDNLLVLVLRKPGGYPLEVVTGRAPIERFTAQTYAMVARGEEYADVDHAAELATLLGGGR